MPIKPQKTEIDLLFFWRILLKRKWIVLTFLLVIVTATAILSFTATPIYQATATILIENPRPEFMSIQELFSGNQYGYGYQDRFFNTQLELLRSRGLGERVVKKMDLPNRPEYQEKGGSSPGLLGTFKNFVTLRWLRGAPKPASPEGGAADTEALQAEYALLASRVIGRIRTSIVEGTGLVQISYQSSNPQLARDVVNTLVEEFFSYSIESRYEATRQASDFLTEQIAQLRTELEVKQRELQRYGQEKNLMFLSNQEDTAVGEFSNLYNAYLQAQIKRVNRESVLRELRGLNLDALSTPTRISNASVSSLLADYLRTKIEYEEKLKFYQESYPEMQRLKSRLDTQKAQLQVEIRNALEAAESEYRAAFKEEETLKAMMGQQRRDVVESSSNKVRYNVLKAEVDGAQALLSFLQSKQQETQVSARVTGQRTSDIRIIDKALLPDRPVSPNVMRNILVSIMWGLFLGLMLAFAVEFMDTSLKSPEDVEKLTGLASLGLVPSYAGDGKASSLHYYTYGKPNRPPSGPGAEKQPDSIELINHHDPNLAISEAYRTIRTSILFSQPDRAGGKILCFTSAFPQEGKSTTAVNMAVSFAQLEEKALLVDCDLRKPRVHKVFKVRNTVGLSNILTGRVQPREAIQNTVVENLKILPCGPIPPNPAELLNSTRMKDLLAALRSSFAYIIVDTPPMLFVSDAAILGSLADSTVIVLRPEKAFRKPFLKMLSELEKAKARVVGVVFNDVNIRKNTYYADHYRYHYRYRYGESETRDERRPLERG
jgi:capsular exopolysaccharide synthesis family protein